jgi:hypothetical protein
VEHNYKFHAAVSWFKYNCKIKYEVMGLICRKNERQSWQGSVYLHVYCRGQRMRGAISSLPHTPSWRGIQLKKYRGNFTFSFFCLLSSNDCFSLYYHQKVLAAIQPSIGLELSPN